MLLCRLFGIQPAFCHSVLASHFFLISSARHLRQALSCSSRGPPRRKGMRMQTSSSRYSLPSALCICASVHLYYTYSTYSYQILYYTVVPPQTGAFLVPALPKYPSLFPSPHFPSLSPFPFHLFSPAKRHRSNLFYSQYRCALYSFCFVVTLFCGSKPIRPLRSPSPTPTPVYASRFHYWPRASPPNAHLPVRIVVHAGGISRPVDRRQPSCSNS